MEGLKTLQQQQTASLASLGTAITDIVLTVKEFMHSSGSGSSRKRKRDELSESDADEHEIDDEIDSVNVDEASVRTRRQKNQQKIRTMFSLHCQRFMTRKAL